MRISDWSSDVCSSDLALGIVLVHGRLARLDWTWQPRRARDLARALGPVALAFVFAFAATRPVPPPVALVGGDVAAGYFEIGSAACRGRGCPDGLISVGAGPIKKKKHKKEMKNR